MAVETDQMGEAEFGAWAAARERAAARPRRRTMGYREAVRWLAYNDDTEWATQGLEPDGPTETIPSVTAVLVADIYGRSEREVLRDLRRALRQRDRDRTA